MSLLEQIEVQVNARTCIELSQAIQLMVTNFQMVANFLISKNAGQCTAFLAEISEVETKMNALRSKMIFCVLDKKLGRRPELACPKENIRKDSF